MVNTPESDPELAGRHKRASDWRPQTGEEKYACAGRDYVQRNRFTLRRSHRSSDAVVKQENTGNESQ
jgi:hypothetical protein